MSKQFATAPAFPSAAQKKRRFDRKALMATFGLGGLSIVLYALLFAFSDQLVTLSGATRQGEKVYAFVPIAIAFLFSLVHGAFTGHFWDLLGLKAKGK